MYLKTNSCHFSVNSRLVAVVKEMGVCLPRCTDWIFKHNSDLINSAPLRLHFIRCIPLEFRNVVLEKDGEDQLDRLLMNECH
jgi:hypothetical protein